MLRIQIELVTPCSNSSFWWLRNKRRGLISGVDFHILRSVVVVWLLLVGVPGLIVSLHIILYVVNDNNRSMILLLLL